MNQYGNYMKKDKKQSIANAVEFSSKDKEIDLRS
jgi:hypothetical protein